MNNEKKPDLQRIAILLAVGLLVGAINGFFGGGGGMICVPLFLALGLSNKKAHATAVLTMLPISVASSIVYYSSSSLNWEMFLLILAGSLVGGLLGALVLKKIPSIWLQFIFALVLIGVGIKMCF